jgi:Protein kinase domain
MTIADGNNRGYDPPGEAARAAATRVVPSQAPPMPPLTLVAGRYRVGQTIASGPHWTLHLADDIEAATYPLLGGVTGQAVRLRLVSRELASQEGVVDRVRQHATLVRELAGRCPALASVHDVGPTADGGLFVVTEAVGGATVAALAERHGPLPLKLALRLAIRIGEAVEAAHNLILIDGRLGPARVSVLEPGNDVKLVDFGLDRALGAEPAIEALPFLAPEVALGAATSERTDVYGLGVIVYTLLTGRLPPGRAGRGAEDAEASGKPTRAGRMPEGIPRGVSMIVMRALDRDPARRQADVSVLLNDLSESLGLAARPGWRSSGALRFLADKWRIAAGVVGVAALLAALGLAYPRVEPTVRRLVQGSGLWLGPGEIGGESTTLGGIPAPPPPPVPPQAPPVPAPAPPFPAPAPSATVPPGLPAARTLDATPLADVLRLTPAPTPPPPPTAGALPSVSPPSVPAATSEAPGIPEMKSPTLPAPSPPPRSESPDVAPSPPRLVPPVPVVKGTTRAPLRAEAQRPAAREPEPKPRPPSAGAETQFPALEFRRAAPPEPSRAPAVELPRGTPPEPERPSSPPRAVPGRDTSEDPGAIIDWLLRDRR